MLTHSQGRGLLSSGGRLLARGRHSPSRESPVPLGAAAASLPDHRPGARDASPAGAVTGAPHAILPQNATSGGGFLPPTLPLPVVPQSRPGFLRLRPRGRLLRPAAGTRHDPMLRNGHALIFSSGITQVIGVFYWVVAARAYPADVVGRNSVALNVMLFLAAVAELNLMSTLIRFLPTSGSQSRRLILTIYAVSASIAAVIGLGFLVLIPRIEPQLAFLRSSPFLAMWFVVAVVVGAIFVLQDGALTGVRAAPFVPVENAAFSVLKLGLMLPLVRLMPASGIFVSWTIAIAIIIIPANGYLFFRAIPGHLQRHPVSTAPPMFRDMRSYVIPDSLAGLFILACTYLLPLLVINRLGPSAAGHYSLAWIIGYALYSVSLNMGSSLLVETAADQSVLRDRCFQSIAHLAKLIAPVVALIILAAPYALLAFGSGYAKADVTVLRLLALSALPAIITNTAVSVTRSQRRMRMVVGIQICVFALVWGLGIALVGPLGITGIGAAWLIAETAVAAVLVIWPRLWLPRGREPRHATIRVS
jgi:O-antigen/teichoic acid export membrane protein